MNEPYVKLQTESIYWDKIKENNTVSSTLQEFKPTLIKNANLETLKSFEGRFLVVPDTGRIYYEYANSENSEPAKRVELGNADLDYVKVLAAAPTSSEGLEKNMFYLVPSISDNIYDLYAVDENDKLVGPVVGKAVKATLTENYGTDYIVSKTSFIRPGKENGQVGSNAVSFGDNNYAGYTCRKVTAYDGEFTLTLEPNPQGYEPANKLAIGDMISIDGGNNYPYCATITAISGNIITVDKTIIDFAGGVLNPNNESHYLFVDGKPNIGTHPLGEGQIAIGLKNHAIAKATTAIGRQNYASGSYAVALGRENKAANYSVALGRNNKATGFNSVALGFDNNATGLYATAIGKNSRAEANYGAAIGLNVISKDTNGQFVIGKYNANSSNALFIVGNGTSESDRKNAFEIQNNGNTIFSGNIYLTGGNNGYLILNNYFKDGKPTCFIRGAADDQGGININNEITLGHGTSTNEGSNGIPILHPKTDDFGQLGYRDHPWKSIHVKEIVGLNKINDMDIMYSKITSLGASEELIISTGRSSGCVCYQIMAYSSMGKSIYTIWLNCSEASSMTIMVTTVKNNTVNGPVAKTVEVPISAQTPLWSAPIFNIDHALNSIQAGKILTDGKYIMKLKLSAASSAPVYKLNIMGG